MKVMKTLLTLALSSLMLLGGNAMAQMQRKAAAPQQAKELKAVQKDHGVTAKLAEMQPVLEKAKMSAKSLNGVEIKTVYVPRYTPSQTKEEAMVGVTLIVEENYYSDGSGQAILLDKDAEIYELINGGTVTYLDGDNMADYFEYAVPEGAFEDPFGPTGMILAQDDDNSASTEVPAGTYDIMVANPDPDLESYYSFGFLNDFVLEAGCQLFVVFDAAGIHVNLYIPYNIAVANVVYPKQVAVGLTAEEEVKVEIFNAGVESIEDFTLKYKFDNGEFKTETLHSHILMGKSEYFTLANKGDFSAAGKHTITVIAEMEEDEDPDNDTLVYTFNNVASITTLPFTYNFNDEEDFDTYWMVDDANGNNNTWYWFEWDEETGNGSARIGYSAPSLGMPESMIYGKPIHLTPGKHHISFMANCSKAYPETYDVLLGTDLDDMKVLKSFKDVTYGEFTMEVINFEIETEGYYYIGFNYYYTDALYMMIDDLTLDKGNFIGTPDLALNALVSPMSSCSLGADEEVIISVSNIGYGPVKSINVTGSLNGEDFTKTLGGLEARKDTVFSLGKFDFSEEKSYLFNIKLEAVIDPEEAKPEDSVRNNEADFEFEHWTPATLPFMNDFSRASALGNWSPTGFLYNEEAQYLYCADTMPMISRCMNLEAGKTYRFGMNFAAGLDYGFFAFYGDYEILYGLSGTDWKNWEVINREEDFIKEDFSYEDFTFTVKESGIYAVAVRGLLGSAVWIQEINVSEVFDYDVRINALSPVPTMIPVEHVNGTYSLMAELENRGNKAVDAKVSVKVNDQAAGNTTANLAVNAVKNVEVELTVSGVAAGATNVPIVGEVEIVGQQDGYTGDNVTYYNTSVTDAILAYDYVIDEMCTDPYKIVGSSSGTLMCVLPIYVTTKDTLTAINVFWGSTEDAPGTAHETRLVVYHLDMEAGELGTQIYEGYERKVAEPGEQSFEIPALLLDKGYYVIGASVTGYELTVDGDANGVIYLLSGNQLGAQTGLGNAGIRAKFGHNGVVVPVDAAVVSIDKPGDRGVFAENQPVSATIANNGYETVSAQVSLMINGVAAGEPKTIELGAYARVAAEFTADLSTPGKYEITFTVSCEGDAVADNNTLSKEVECITAGDAYNLDFEACDDWAYEVFVPAWKTVDRDGYASPGFQSWTYPNAAEAKAFIVFNPATATPALDNAEPYQGDKFGASLYASYAPNNDWLISPKLLLPDENASMSLAVKSWTDDYGLESYNVLVSTTDDEPESFTALKSGQAPAEWEVITVDLSDYNGQNVYLAVQCVSNDVAMFMVDDIKVSKPVANEKNLVSTLKLYPNPARQMITITGADIENVAIYNVSGRQVYASNNVKGDFRYNVSNLAKGMYFANVKTANGSVVMKFIVE